MNKYILIFLLAFISTTLSLNAQKSVNIDGRLQPILNDFFKQCDAYGIDYNEKLFQLKNIDISNSLPLEEANTVLGMVTRDSDGNVENILINWAAMLDAKILKVVAFHEFAHHFLDYKHTCQDCNEIMAVVNTSYFDIANDWDSQVRYLFTTSPVYLAMHAQNPIAAITLE